MVKAIAGSIVVVLLVSSGAMAQIDLQYQGWDLGLTNGISVSGGPGEASTTQGVGTLDIQNMGINPDLNGDPTVTASQGIGAALFQTGAVETNGALVTVDQDLTVVGDGLTVNGQLWPAGQTQMVGDLSGPTLQYQGVTVSGSEGLEKGEGSIGAAESLNLVGFGMGQMAQNNCADGCQLAVILGGQHTEIEGAAQSVGTVDATMTATVNQFQAANGVAP